MCFVVSYFSGVCVCFVSAVYFCVFLLFVWRFFVKLVCIFTVSGLAGYSELYALCFRCSETKDFTRGFISVILILLYMFP